MNTIREIQQINEQELARGLAGTSGSWHQKYLHSAWVYVGNLDTALSEGDVLCVMSQYGEVDDINLVRDDATGRSRGFCFLKYEDARSAVLAVDNLTGADVCGRALRVDHVEQYRLPKHLQDKEDGGPPAAGPGHAYAGKNLENAFSLQQGQDLFAPVQDRVADSSDEARRERQEEKRRRRDEKDKRKREKKERKADREERHRKKRAKRHRDD